MSKVFANIALSLDGYMAPDGMTLEHWEDPSFKDWGAKWGSLMRWLIGLETFRSTHGFGPGGETGVVNDMMRATSARIGANIMGRRMFDAGERSWPEDAPFHVPVFVLTHQAREPWVRPGGTTFHFVTDGPASALAQAKEAAGTKDVRIAGGADVLQQYLKMGAVEELEIALAPVLFGSGRRLFENLGDGLQRFQVDRALHTPLATHLRYLPA